jgi:hypothetical protein
MTRMDRLGIDRTKEIQQLDEIVDGVRHGHIADTLDDRRHAMQERTLGGHERRGVSPAPHPFKIRSLRVEIRFSP